MKVKFFERLHLLKKCYRGFQARNYVFLVYTYGKVGSSSVYATLKREIYKAEVFHVHFLGDYWLNEKLPDTNKEKNIEIALNVHSFLKENSNKKLVFISLVREPISREISNLFQNPEDFFEGRPLEELTALEAITALQNKIKEKTDYVTEWFREDFVPVTKLNILQEPFDMSSGYSIYQLQNNTSVLFFRMEDLNKTFIKAFQKATTIKLPQILRTNEGKNKVGQELYDEVKRKFSLTTQEADEIYDASYVRHFYTEEEISSFKKKYTS